MNSIKYIGTDDTPSITLDAQSGTFELAGRSMPEDVTSFYSPILEWIDKYSQEPNEHTVFNFKLTYFNTASSKLILDILVKLEEIKENGHELLVHWFYPDIDEDMKEAGEEYAEMIEIPFELIAYKK